MIHHLKKLLNKQNTFFSSPPPDGSLFRSNTQAPHAQGIHTIESLKSLHQLLHQKQTQKEPPQIRFLVDTKGAAWFANETFPGISAPKHFQMTTHAQTEAYCKTAGNIKFTNTACTKLKNINHKSGDFHPSFESIKWILAILVIHENVLSFKLPKIMIIKELDEQGETRKKHYWRLSTIKRWVNTFSHNQSLMTKLMAQNHSPTMVHYQNHLTPDVISRESRDEVRSLITA